MATPLCWHDTRHHGSQGGRGFRRHCEDDQEYRARARRFRRVFGVGNPATGETTYNLPPAMVYATRVPREGRSELWARAAVTMGL